MPQNSYPLYLCGLNKPLIHWELSLQKVELFTINHFLAVYYINTIRKCG